jgi:hypothetical protein
LAGSFLQQSAPLGVGIGKRIGDLFLDRGGHEPRLDVIGPQAFQLVARRRVGGIGAERLQHLGLCLETRFKDLQRLVKKSSGGIAGGPFLIGGGSFGAAAYPRNFPAGEQRGGARQRAFGQ